MAFAVAAFVVGWLAERGWDRGFATAVLAMALGSLVIYALGVSWLAQYLGWHLALVYGVLPFWGGDLIKLVIAATVLPGGWWLLRTLAPDMIGAPVERHCPRVPRALRADRK